MTKNFSAAPIYDITWQTNSFPIHYPKVGQIAKQNKKLKDLKKDLKKAKNEKKDNSEKKDK